MKKKQSYVVARSDFFDAKFSQLKEELYANLDPIEELARAVECLKAARAWVALAITKEHAIIDKITNINDYA